MSKLKVTPKQRTIFDGRVSFICAYCILSAHKPHDGLNSFDGISDPGIIRLPGNTKQLYIAHHGSTIWHGIHFSHVVSFWEICQVSTKCGPCWNSFSASYFDFTILQKCFSVFGMQKNLLKWMLASRHVVLSKKMYFPMTIKEKRVMSKVFFCGNSQ